MRLVAEDTLTAALGLPGRGIVALVGGGGKTGTLQLLARESTGSGRSVVVGTTTAMFLRELAVVGPVVFGPLAGSSRARLRETPARGHVVAIALSEGAGGKVVGLPPADIDTLWAGRVVDQVIVEADGSRGRSLKAFAAHEPQLPAQTGTIVQVAGLDIVGCRLDEAHVHRPELLREALGIAPGSLLTARIVAGALRIQLAMLRRLRPGARLVTLLNKADRPADDERALAVAAQLMRGGSDDRSQRPDRIAVASLHAARFARVAVEA